MFHFWFFIPKSNEIVHFSFSNNKTKLGTIKCQIAERNLRFEVKLVTFQDVRVSPSIRKTRNYFLANPDKYFPETIIFVVTYTSFGNVRTSQVHRTGKVSQFLRARAENVRVYLFLVWDPCCSNSKLCLSSLFSLVSRQSRWRSHLA